MDLRKADICSGLALPLLHLGDLTLDETDLEVSALSVAVTVATEATVVVDPLAAEAHLLVVNVADHLAKMTDASVTMIAGTATDLGALSMATAR